MDFHAHVYYDAAHRDEALWLHGELQDRTASLNGLVSVYPLVDRLIGPHLWPMFEIEFSAQVYEPMLAYLRDNHGNLPVLIHPLTDDEIANHGELAQWLGETLPLNWERLGVHA